MPRSTIIFIFILTIIASLLGYNYFAQPFANHQPSSVGQLKSPLVAEKKSATADDKENLVNQLSPKQQILQLIAAPYLLPDKDSTESGLLAWIGENKPGVVTLFGENISTNSAQVMVENIDYSVNEQWQPLIAVDHEGGSVQRLSGAGFTDLPSWEALCETTADNRQQLLTASAAELSQAGINIVLAPVLDIASQSAVLGSRICSSDPEITAQRAAEYINIFNQQNIVSVIKHFPGIGSAATDLHREYDEVAITEPEILVFKEILDNYQQLGVMTAHVGVKDLYQDQPCSLNPDCVSDLTDHFAEALVFSDALEMKAAGHQPDSEELSSLGSRAVAAVAAGNDVLLFGPSINEKDLDEIEAALMVEYEINEEFRQQVVSSVEKILAYKKLFRP